MLPAWYLRTACSMRIFSATLATETNTFSPLPTSLEAYKESVFLRPGEHPGRHAADVHGAAVRRPAPGRRETVSR